MVIVNFKLSGQPLRLLYIDRHHHHRFIEMLVANATIVRSFSFSHPSPLTANTYNSFNSLLW